MEAIIKADLRRGPGYGIIAISAIGQIQEVQVTEGQVQEGQGNGPSFVLQRADDRKSLAANGCWQESASLLRPDAWQVHDNVLYLAIGPALVNELDMLGAYRIQLVNWQAEAQASDLACVLSFGKLVYSNIGGGQGIIGAGAEMNARPADSPVQSVQEKKPADPAPQAGTEAKPPAQTPPDQTAGNIRTDPVQATGGLDKLSMDVAPKKSSSGNWLAVIIVLAILGLMAWAGWWWLQKGEGEVARPLPPIGQQGKKAQTADPLPGQALPDPRAAAGKNQANALAQAREHLRGSADPATSLALAKSLRTADASSGQSDAAFLLLEDAAQKGQAEAMYLLGQFYDPVSTLPHGSIPLDMEQAWLWYARAAENGISQAGKALKDLHAHASREAKKDNALARRLLREWKQ